MRVGRSARSTCTLGPCSTGQREPERSRVGGRLGCYFSVNTEMLRNERHHSMIAALHESRLLTEIDGPFTSVGDWPPRLADVRATVEVLAWLRDQEAAQVAAAIRTNLRTMLS